VVGAAATAGTADGAGSGGFPGFKTLTLCSATAAMRSAGSMGAEP
jgi:hypothetical protein